MVTTIALVLAAGRGSRMQLDSPKQYADLCGKPVLRWSVETFLEHQHIDRVFVVYHPADRLLYENATAGLALPNPISGGSTRQESAKRGLEALEIHNPDRVLIHDGARPFVKTSLINDLLDSLFNTNAVVPGLPIVDTLKRVIELRESAMYHNSVSEYVIEYVDEYIDGSDRIPPDSWEDES